MPSLRENAAEGAVSYLGHFDFIEPPFDAAPNPRFAQGTHAQSHNLRTVTNAVLNRESLIVVTGEEGAGKTTLCLGLAQQFGARTFPAVLLDPPAEGGEFLHKLLVDFGVSSGAGPAPLPAIQDLHTALERFLISLAPIDAHAVIVIDEAERLSTAVLEEILRLSNFTENHPGLLQIVLVGQPSLIGLLQQPAVGRMNLRIAARHRLPPLQHRTEVKQYIERRLWIAHGGAAALSTASRPAAFRRPRFTDAAVALIAQRSSGNPRRINAICDRALAIAVDRSKDRIGLLVAMRAAAELGLRGRMPFLSSTPKAAAATIGSLVGATLLLMPVHRSRPVQENAPAAPSQAPSAQSVPAFDAFERDALERATALSLEPNVHGLLKLRDEIEVWDTQTQPPNHQRVEDFRTKLERLTDEARRRQLDRDRLLILEDSKRQ